MNNLHFANVIVFITFSLSLITSRAQDTDLDGLSDDDETSMGTDLFNPDSDGDGNGDGWVAWGYGFDTDLDGLPGDYEFTVLGTDSTLNDTDGDGLSDGYEATYGTGDPLIADTD